MHDPLKFDIYKSGVLFQNRQYTSANIMSLFEVLEEMNHDFRADNCCRMMLTVQLLYVFPPHCHSLI